MGSDCWVDGLSPPPPPPPPRSASSWARSAPRGEPSSHGSEPSKSWRSASGAPVSLPPARPPEMRYPAAPVVGILEHIPRAGPVVDRDGGLGHPGDLTAIDRDLDRRLDHRVQAHLGEHRVHVARVHLLEGLTRPLRGRERRDRGDPLALQDLGKDLPFEIRALGPQQLEHLPTVRAVAVGVEEPQGHPGDIDRPLGPSEGRRLAVHRRRHVPGLGDEALRCPAAPPAASSSRPGPSGPGPGRGGTGRPADRGSPPRPPRRRRRPDPGPGPPGGGPGAPGAPRRSPRPGRGARRPGCRGPGRSAPRSSPRA